MDASSDDEGPPELVEGGRPVPVLSDNPSPGDISKKVPITIVTGADSSFLLPIAHADGFDAQATSAQANLPSSTTSSLRSTARR